MVYTVKVIYKKENITAFASQITVIHFMLNTKS